MRKMMILSAFVAAAAITAPGYAQMTPPASESGADQAPDQAAPPEADPDTQQAPDQATPPAPDSDAQDAPDQAAPPPPPETAPPPQSSTSTSGDTAQIQMLPQTPVVQPTAQSQTPSEYPRCTATKKDECRGR